MSNENKQPDERAAFEAWARKELADGEGDPCKRGQCGYLDSTVDQAWIGWQARATQQAAKGDERAAFDEHGLLACPFCGNALFVKTGRSNPSARCATDGCKGKSLPLLNLDQPSDIAAWNTRATPHPVAGSAGQAPIYQNKLKRADSWCDCDKATFDHASKHPQRFDVRVLYATPTAPSLTTDAVGQRQALGLAISALESKGWNDPAAVLRALLAAHPEQHVDGESHE